MLPSVRCDSSDDGFRCLLYHPARSPTNGRSKHPVPFAAFRAARFLADTVFALTLFLLSRRNGWLFTEYRAGQRSIRC